jgi:hypothetical protein
MSGDVLVNLFAAACPALVLTLGFQRAVASMRWSMRGWKLLLVPGALAAGLLLLPIGGIVVARWVAGVSANFSMPFIGTLAVAAWERAFSRRIFSERDWETAWGFGAVGGLGLYPLALGVGSVDPYEWGWRFSPLFVVIGALTVRLIWKQNRFGLLLLLAAVAFHLRLLESTNYWDYLLDPVYCMASLVALGRGLAARGRGTASLIPDP